MRARRVLPRDGHADLNTVSCVESVERNFELYLAVSTLDPATQPNRTGASLPDAKGSLQIWTVSPGNGLNETGVSAEFYDPADDAEMRCSMVLCFEGGPIIDFKWMPIGCCDRVSRSIRYRGVRD